MPEQDDIDQLDITTEDRNRSGTSIEIQDGGEREILPTLEHQALDTDSPELMILQISQVIAEKKEEALRCDREKIEEFGLPEKSRLISGRACTREEFFPLKKLQVDQGILLDFLKRNEGKLQNLIFLQTKNKDGKTNIYNIYISPEIIKSHFEYYIGDDCCLQFEFFDEVEEQAIEILTELITVLITKEIKRITGDRRKVVFII